MTQTTDRPTAEELRQQLAEASQQTAAFARQIAEAARRFQASSGVARGPVEQALAKLAEGVGAEIPPRTRRRFTVTVMVPVQVSGYLDEDWVESEDYVPGEDSPIGEYLSVDEYGIASHIRNYDYISIEDGGLDTEEGLEISEHPSESATFSDFTLTTEEID